MTAPIPTHSLSPSFASSMQPFDEMRDSTGEVRPHWRHYFEFLDALGPAEAKARWTKAKRLLQENGVSYNVYGDSSSTERPWRLSPIPLVLSAEDWQSITRGIDQRARLLSSLLADLYGPQNCLMSGALPPELVFGNPHFLRPMHGFGPQHIPRLTLYALDLIRAPQGQFMALEDVVQSPSGMGYALENRVVVAQVLPDLLRQCNVERLVPFFRQLFERMQGAAPHNRDAPRIALLTPGPYSSTYFEQAYLAKYLGISLVQGEDLTVRNDRVYMKTLGGLQAIDVLLRRVFDSYCDPLELRADSALGVPGLVQALRSGNVRSINPLGSGVLESPAFLSYLPRLCREFLNEDLVLESVPTYYCGDPRQLERALAELDQMVIKPTYSEMRAEPIFVSRLEPSERESLRQKIIATPQDFVAQRFVPASRTPIIYEGKIDARSCILRCFAHCGKPNDYQVMPGGLALVATTADDLAVSIHRGARSKDVWVISDESVLGELVVPPANPPIELSRGGGDLPSRVADNLYWLGRYAERAEAVSRLARVIGLKSLDSADAREYARSLELGRIMNALRAQTRFMYAADQSPDSSLQRAATEAELTEAIADEKCAGSLVAALRSTLRVSRVVRDRLSHDTLRILTSLEESSAHCSALAAHDRLPQLVNELNQIVIALAAFSGMVMESMTRGFAWRFLDMGRRLERAMALVTLLRATLTVPSERDAQVIELVLDVADSGMTYRRRYSAGLQVAPAVDLLLADEANPRSVIYQLHTLGQHVAALPSLSSIGTKTTQQRLLLATTTKVELTDIIELCRTSGTDPRRDRLVELLDHLGHSLPALSDSLTETYLYHANVARHLRGGVSDLAVLAAARGGS